MNETGWQGIVPATPFAPLGSIQNYMNFIPSLPASLLKLASVACVGLAFFAQSAVAGSAAVSMTPDEGFFSDESMVSDDELSGSRGRAGTLISGDALGIAVLTGVSSNNISTGGVTGSNVVSNNAFDNANGVAFVVQNSGNNAVINAALVINLNIQ